jgi:hypothetical protein
VLLALAIGDDLSEVVGNGMERGLVGCPRGFGREILGEHFVSVMPRHRCVRSAVP